MCRRRGTHPLRRAAGAGHPYGHDPPDPALIALVWIQACPTYELLGILFGLDKSSAGHNTQDALEVLADFPFDPPGKGRTRVATGTR